MRTDQISKTDWSAFDDLTKPLYKKTLGLLPNAANEILYGSREDSLLGIPLAAEDFDISHIDNINQTTYLKR